MAYNCMYARIELPCPGYSKATFCQGENEGWQNHLPLSTSLTLEQGKEIATGT